MKVLFFPNFYQQIVWVDMGRNWGSQVIGNKISYNQQEDLFVGKSPSMLSIRTTAQPFSVEKGDYFWIVTCSFMVLLPLDLEYD